MRLNGIFFISEPRSLVEVPEMKLLRLFPFYITLPSFTYPLTLRASWSFQRLWTIGKRLPRMKPTVVQWNFSHHQSNSKNTKQLNESETITQCFDSLIYSWIIYLWITNCELSWIIVNKHGVCLFCTVEVKFNFGVDQRFNANNPKIDYSGNISSYVDSFKMMFTISENCLLNEASKPGTSSSKNIL